MLGLLIAAALFIYGIAGTYQQGKQRGWEDHEANREMSKGIFWLTQIPLQGWVYDWGYDRGWDDYAYLMGLLVDRGCDG